MTTDIPTSTEEFPRSRTGAKTWPILGLLFLVHTGLLAWSAFVSAPTTDEPGHLLGGLSEWKFGRFDVYRVTGPLVRLVAAVPVRVAGYQMDWSDYTEYPGSRAEYPLSFKFCQLNGQRTCWLMTLARWACIPFSLLGLYFCYRWGRELFGIRAGLLAGTLWCFSPNILGNAQMITTDVAGSALFITGSYVFWRWTKHPRWTTAMLAGSLLGLMLLSKATFVILFGVWPVMWLIIRWGVNAERNIKPWARESVQLAVAFVMAIYVLNSMYGFEGTFLRLDRYEFVCSALKGDNGAETEFGNRFEGTWLGAIPVPLPVHFVRGIDTQKRYFERTLRSYLRGEWRQGGWWYYYLYAMLIKLPLGTWLIFLLAVFLAVDNLSSGTSRRKYTCHWRDEFALLLPFISVLFLVSSQLGFNKNFRYALPVLPLMFVWMSRSAGLLSKVAEQQSEDRDHNSATDRRSDKEDSLTRDSMSDGMETGSRRRGTVRFLNAEVVLLVFAICWSTASSLWIFPHSLSYFNEFVGGPKRGHEHLIHTNIDWAQDLLFLDRWMESHQNGRRLYLAYYGIFNPEYLDLTFQLPPKQLLEEPGSASGNETGPLLEPGLYAISVNLLRGHRWRIFNGRGGREMVSGRDYSYFLEREPIAMAGYSIYIYEITSEDSQSLP